MGREMIVPEVSRVTREPVDGDSTNQSDFLLQLFKHPRSFSEYVAHLCAVFECFVSSSDWQTEHIFCTFVSPVLC